MPEIGETLREARMRRRIDMAEVESATKIRAKYLRALESEEWELLPGPTFVKTFLRTYADYLELDARLLVEEYKQRFERPAGLDVTPLNLRRQRRRRRVAPRLGPGLVVVVLGIVVLLGALYLLGVSGNGGDETRAARRRGDRRRPPATTRRARRSAKKKAEPAKPVSVSIVATGQVYVCMEDARGRAIVDKRTLRGRPAHAHLPQPRASRSRSAPRPRGSARTARPTASPPAATPSATPCAPGASPQRITSGLAGCT